MVPPPQGPLGLPITIPTHGLPKKATEGRQRKQGWAGVPGASA